MPWIPPSARLQAVTAHWSRDDLIVRREMLGLQPGEVVTATDAAGVWLEMPVFVVDDGPEQLVTFTAPDAPFRFPEGSWPTPDGRHPWHGRAGWQGNGCLMVQQPTDHYAVWHFWDGPDREFVCWYLDLQTAFVRTPAGYQTQDLSPGGRGGIDRGRSGSPIPPGTAQRFPRRERRPVRSGPRTAPGTFGLHAITPRRIRWHGSSDCGGG